MEQEKAWHAFSHVSSSIEMREIVEKNKNIVGYALIFSPSQNLI